MRKIALAPAALLCLPLLACPLGPKDEETDSGAGDTTGRSTTDPEPAPEPASPAQPETASTCEDELAKVKAELAECRAR